jgi:DNA polymerase III subunit epsilon
MDRKQSNLEKAKEMNDILYLGKEFVVIDLETTTLSPEKGGMIIEVAGVKIKDNKIVDTFNQLINPERKIYSRVTELTGITNEMLQGKPVYGEVLPKFYRFIGNAIVVAHNAPFDWDRYLLYFFPKVGIFPTNKVIDTLLLSKLYFPNKSRYSLDEMCKELGVKLENHHRALNDSLATAEMLLIFKEKYATKLYNPSFVLEGEQMDLFNLAFQMEEEEKEEVAEKAPLQLEMGETSKEKKEVPEKKEYKVKRVKYWEKRVNKNKCYKRLYVTLSNGTVFFDIPTKTWYNKDVQESIDFEAVHESVLRYLNLQSVEELCNYRN